MGRLYIPEKVLVKVERCPLIIVKVACTRYRMMTSEVSQ